MPNIDAKLKHSGEAGNKRVYTDFNELFLVFARSEGIRAI